MKLAVFFPGIGYHCDKPLLYYSRKLAQECGYEETIALSYTYDGGNIQGNEEKMQQAFESLYEQAEKSLSAVDFDKYDEILFVAKSVGTIIASAYAEKHSIRCRQILYTPLKFKKKFCAFRRTQNNLSFPCEYIMMEKTRVYRDILETFFWKIRKKCKRFLWGCFC